jgi:hypothetical protein
MGAWGYLAFENDDALDWLEELETGGADVVRQALAKAGDRYVEAPDGATAIAAAEVTSASQGNRGELPSSVADWVTAPGLEINRRGRGDGRRSGRTGRGGEVRAG